MSGRFRLRRPDEYPDWEDADRGTRMQILRALSGMTQLEAARVAGVDVKAVQRAEVDPSRQYVETLDVILAALGYTLQDLLGREPPEHD